MTADPHRPATANTVAGGAQIGACVQAQTITTLHLHHPTTPLPPPVPRQLPPTPGAFTDRTKDLRALAGNLGGDGGGTGPGVRIIAVSGPAGIGKTAFAARFLHTVAGRFPGGQLLAELHGGGPGRTAEVLGALIRALRPGPLPARAAELAAWWRSVTAALPGPVAVLADGATAAAQVEALLPGGAGHLVVVTSRHPLPGLARHAPLQHPLAPLAPADARTMLDRCAGPARTAAEPAAAQQIVTLAAGVPLALALTAAQAAAQPHRPLAGLAADLARHHRITRTRTAPAPTVPAHHQHQDCAVTTALDHAYTTLTTPAARVYRLLGTLPATGIDTALTAAATALPPAAATQALRELTAARLLDHVRDHPVRGPVHAFPGAARAHARDRCALEEADGAPAEALARALDWYLTGATAAERCLTPTHQRARHYTHPPARSEDHTS